MKNAKPPRFSKVGKIKSSLLVKQESEDIGIIHLMTTLHHSVGSVLQFSVCLLVQYPSLPNLYKPFPVA